MGFANLDKYLSMLRGIHKHNLLRVLAPPPLAGRVAAAVVLLEPVVEVAEAGRVDAVAKKPAEAEPRATGRGGGGVAGRGAAAARRPRLADGLAIDNADLNSFFGELMKVVPPEFVQRLENRSGVANPEKKGVCDFNTSPHPCSIPPNRP